MVTKNRALKMVNCRYAQNGLENKAFVCTITSIYSNHRYGNRFVTILGGKKYLKNRCFPGRDGIFAPFFPEALTIPLKYVTFYLSKALTKDMRSQKEPQRGAHLVRGLRYTAGIDTTFRAAGRKCSDGHARYRVNE